MALAAAEADPWVYSTGLVGAPVAYAGLHAPLAYGLPYAHHPVVYTAAAGCQNDAGGVVPCAHGGLVGVIPALAAPAAAPAVVSERKKREAEATAEADASPEAEADAWVYYRTHGYWPHGFGHLAYSYAPYAYSGHYGYYGLGHHYGYYGKREAEAAPEAAASPDAEADPYLLYGAYGHGLYGGHYGYGYHGYSAYGHHGLGYALGGCRNYLGGLVPCAAGR